ncbi:unnamed protein product [Auanema sp. JU1783]|nr:unnamed protein product [Auanema sp. JU1783]
MMESDEDDRRGREKFVRERDHKREDDRYNGGLKRSGSRREEYNGSKRGRLDSEHDRDEGVLLSFKKFLLTQEDDITDEQAVAKYNDYKVEFSRKILQKFFNAHKDEEWFRQKYHPDEVAKISASHIESVKKRLDIFEDLRSKGAFDNVTLDQEHTQDIIKILDSVVVLLEGGTNDDLEALKNETLDDDGVSDTEKHTKEEKTESSDEKPADGTVSEADENDKKKSSCLHKTSSIFIRNIPPNVTTEELEALCKRSPGFLRLALGDAASDKKFSRRAWATYKRDVNIKEICWNINNVRVKDSDLSAIINRDLTRRLRTTNGITAHKQVALNDLRIAAKLAAIYDKRLGLHGDEGIPMEERLKDIRMGVDLIGNSKNPLVKQAKMVLMDTEAEEISPEEEELLRRSGDSSGGSEEKGVFTREETVLKALDKLVFYLRVVHSVDFYGHLDYPNEDNMPSRCGILHVRGQAPNGTQWGTSDDGKALVSNKFITDFISGFNQRIELHLVHTDYITDEELAKLGKKDGEKEVELFIEANTVELAKDKWLCPLSGKKFKGPEFIRKHLLTKHEDKLNEVKQEAEFFNNYVADPRRPSEPESKAAAATGGREDDRRDDRYRSTERSRGPASRGYGGYGGAGQPRDYGRGAGGRYFEDAGRRESRPQVSYKDLDAPDDIV